MMVEEALSEKPDPVVEMQDIGCPAASFRPQACAGMCNNRSAGGSQLSAPAEPGTGIAATEDSGSRAELSTAARSSPKLWPWPRLVARGPRGGGEVARVPRLELGTLPCLTKSACVGSGLRSAVRRNSGPAAVRSERLGRGLSEAVARGRPGSGGGGGGSGSDGGASFPPPETDSRSNRWVPMPIGVATKRQSRLLLSIVALSSPSGQLAYSGEAGQLPKPSNAGDSPRAVLVMRRGERPPGDHRGGGTPGAAGGWPRVGEGSRGGTGPAPSSDRCLIAEAPVSPYTGAFLQGVMGTPTPKRLARVVTTGLAKFTVAAAAAAACMIGGGGGSGGTPRMPLASHERSSATWQMDCLDGGAKSKTLHK